ncbi:hypothetical protein M0804_009688 [Polistes exclamans]|nr:hypothetical protein M0804_009688 [Polistes exclamans]
MARYKLEKTILVLLIYYRININPELTAADLFINGHFAKFKICAATVKYWFRTFTEYPKLFPSESIEVSISIAERLSFLNELIRNNPFWTIEDFMDALKLSHCTIRRYINRLGFIKSPRGYIQK